MSQRNYTYRRNVFFSANHTEEDEEEERNPNFEQRNVQFDRNETQEPRPDYIDEIDENIDQINRFFDCHPPPSSQLFYHQTSHEAVRLITSSPVNFDQEISDQRQLLHQQQRQDFNFVDPNDVSPLIKEPQSGKFKLPPRLAARLAKYEEKKNNPTSTASSSSSASSSSKSQSVRFPMRTVENFVQPELIRRETIVVRRKKSSPNSVRKIFGQIVHQKQPPPQPLPLQPPSGDNNRAKANETFDADSNQSTPISGVRPDASRQLNRTILLDTDEDDARYTDWFNSAIKFSFDIENVNADLRRIVADCVLSADTILSGESSKPQNQQQPKQPLKDAVSSLAYKQKDAMERLRGKAKIFYEENVKSVADCLRRDIELAKYHIRKDKNLHADVGAKKHVLEIFSNYNPLWLKVALECVFRTRIEPSDGAKSRNEVHQVLHVLAARLLSFKELAVRRGFKNVTTYFMKEKNVIAAKKHVLYHFLITIHFLDVAKRRRLIEHDPCLFRPDAAVKSTRDVLISFSRDYITGVGDITKAVRGAGVQLEHIQLPIEETNFCITKLSTDLRDGVLLGRLAEILLQRNDILANLQFPPNSITRKIHNMELVFGLLKPHFVSPLPKTVTPRDVCNGSRTKTVSLLDQCIELYNQQARVRELEQATHFVIRIQRFWRRCADSRAQRKEFLRKRSATISIQRWWRSSRVMLEERRRYLAIRDAAIFVQRKFRANRAATIELRRFVELRVATLLIQRRFRASIAMKQSREEFLKLKWAAITVQRTFRRNRIARSERQEFIEKRTAAVMIQAYARGYLARRAFENMKAANRAAITIQRRFRATQLMRIERQRFETIRTAAIKIQRYFRSYLEMRSARADFLLRRKSAIIIQTRTRGFLQRKRYLNLREKVILLQRETRAWLIGRRVRAEYCLLRVSVVTIQRQWRQRRLMLADRANFASKRNAALTIQRAYRAHREREQFLRLREAAIVVQRRFRSNRAAKLERSSFVALRRSVIAIQRRWRAILRERELTRAAICVQRRFRAKLEARSASEQFLRMREAAIILQRRFRANREARAERLRFTQLRAATIFVQRHWRESKRGNRILSVFFQYVRHVNSAAITIQSFWRGSKTRRQLDTTRPVLPLIRVRLSAANANYSADRTLLSLCRRILERIQRARSINTLQKDLKALDRGAEISREICCLIISNEWMIQLLIGSADSLNRSEPHKFILCSILGVLNSLLRHTGTEVLYGREDILIALAVRNFRNFGQTAKDSKNGLIMSRSVSLLLRLFGNRNSLKLFKSNVASLDFVRKYLHDQIRRSASAAAADSSSKLITESMTLLKMLSD